MISQTTNDATYFKKVVGEASLRFREVRAVNTICYDTGERQTEVRELCDKVEVLIVVGGRMSANTRHLAEIGAEILPAGPRAPRGARRGAAGRLVRGLRRRSASRRGPPRRTT